jgi:membrane-associated phospholipid phosphatase
MGVGCLCMCQDKDTLVKKIDSLTNLPDSNNIRRESYNELTKINAKTYFFLLGNDFKQQATAPFHIKGDQWLKLAGFGALTGAVMLNEKKIQVFARELNQRNTQVSAVSKYVTRFGGTYEVYTLAALSAYGFIFKNQKIRTTTLLATQAYITSYAWFQAGKFIFGRQRPNYIDPATGDVAPKFHGPFYQFKKIEGAKPANNAHSSFPSGHTTLAFAAATVYAMEYRDRPLVPIIAYSAASIVGLTRITENRHWASDILVGAALGHLCGRQVVNNFHRYARLKRPATRNTVSFNIQYAGGIMLPGIVYHIH